MLLLKVFSMELMKLLRNVFFRAGVQPVSFKKSDQVFLKNQLDQQFALDFTGSMHRNSSARTG